MLIEEMPIECIVPYDNNPRINADAVDAVAKSIRAYGVRQPLVVDESNVLIVGHTRLLAMKKLGFKTAPVHVARGLTPEQARGYRIADNQTASIAEWDDAKLIVELQKLQEANYDLDLLGFDEAELQRFLTADPAPGLTDADDVPEVPAEPITRRGDLIVLGDHRLLCGDSTNAEDVARLLDRNKPFLMITDPPYGVEYSPEWRTEAGVSDSARMGKVTNDDRDDWSAAYRLFPGDVCYVWHASSHAIDVGLHLRQTGFDIRSCIIWKKQALVLSRGHYHWMHEPAWYAVRKGKTAKWCGDRTQSTVWEIARKDDTGTTTHSTQKPVECMARPIRNHGSKDDSVFDPFLGSGTTLIACEMLGRRCFGLEIEPGYCDQIVARFEAFTGKKAIRPERSIPVPVV